MTFDRFVMMSTSLTGTPCALCAQHPVDGGTGLCAGHHAGAETGWAAVNRIMCDFLHRGVAPPRLEPAERVAGGDSRYAAEVVCRQ